MISSLKRKQQQKKLREELRTRIRSEQGSMPSSEKQRVASERVAGQSHSDGWEYIARQGCSAEEKHSAKQKGAAVKQKRSMGKQERLVQKRTDTKEGSSKKRLLYPKAWIVLVALALIALLLALNPFSSSDPGILQLGTRGMLESFSLSKDESASKGTIEVESDVSWQGSYSNNLPAGFEEEIALQGDSPFAVSSDGRTIGFTRKGSASEVMASIQNDLEAKGWTCVPSGQDSATTFVKDEGLFRWLAVTCVSVEDEVSVVLVPAENGDAN